MHKQRTQTPQVSQELHQPVFTADFSIYGHEMTGMGWAGGNLFRGEIPGTLVGDIEFHVESTDRYGNTGISATHCYVSTPRNCLLSAGVWKNCLRSVVGSPLPAPIRYLPPLEL